MGCCSGDLQTVGLTTISVANTATDGTGAVTLATGSSPTTGAYIDHVIIVAGATTTTGMIRFFVDNGSDVALIATVPVTAVSSVTPPNKPFQQKVDIKFTLKDSTWILKATTHVAETFYLTAIGENNVRV